MNTRGYIELMREKLNASYYRITRLIGVTDATMDNWRKGKREAKPENAVKMADLLHLDRALVVAELDVERAENEEVKSVRLQILERLKKTAVLALVAGLGLAGTPSDKAFAAQNIVLEYTLCEVMTGSGSGSKPLQVLEVAPCMSSNTSARKPPPTSPLCTKLTPRGARNRSCSNTWPGCSIAPCERSAAGNRIRIRTR